MIRHRSSSWLAMSPQQRLDALTQHAATGAPWREFEEAHGLALQSATRAAWVLGIDARGEPKRVRAGILASLAQGAEKTVADLRADTKGSHAHVKHAIQVLREAGLIRSTVRKVEVDDVCKAWGQYVITAAGLKELERTAPRKAA